jgi:hypothetical protein
MSGHEEVDVTPAQCNGREVEQTMKSTTNSKAATPAVPTATRVVKTLRAHQAGAQRWHERFGERLVCVRYREDPDACQRYITVEVLVDTKPIRAAALPGRPAAPPTPFGRRPSTTRPVTGAGAGIPPSDSTRLVRVRIAPADEALRQRAYAAGAVCDPRQPIWTMPLATARALRVLRRIIHDEQP